MRDETAEAAVSSEAPPVAARYHHGDLRAALVRAGLVMLERDGVRGLSLRALAREAGVSHSAPAHHFPNAAALLAGLIIAGFDRLSAFVESESAAPPEDRLPAMAAGYLAFAREHPALLRLMFDRGTVPDRPTNLAAAASRAYDLLSGAVREATRTAGAELSAATDAVWSLMHGHAVLATDGRLCADGEAQIKRATRALMQGWKAAPT